MCGCFLIQQRKDGIMKDTLKRCKQCGFENYVEKATDKCPQCEGALVTKSSKDLGCTGTFIFLGFVALIVGFFAFYGGDSKQKSTTKERVRQERTKTKEELRKEELGKYFSSWDGSHKGLSRFIKSAMNDPDSYDHVETVYWDQGDHLVVKTTFRGKNKFGAIVKNWIKAKVDLKGNVLEIISQGP
jgi:hypothetical protein